MGCVPSSTAHTDTAETRTSSSASKPQQHVELATKSSTKDAGSPAQTAVAPKTEKNEIDRGADADAKSETSLTNQTISKAADPTPTVEKQHEPIDTGVVPKVEPSPLVIETNPVSLVTGSSESKSPKEDAKSGNDELMLDFDTFVLIPEVQQVVAEGSVKADMLQELFDIVDKDADGFVNDQEREDLLELISLSYGAKSKPTTPVNSGTKTTSAEPTEPLPPVPILVLKAPIETSTQAPTEAEAPGPAEPPAAADTPVATEESAGGVSPLTSEASTSTKSGKRKPKIIKFISPELVVPGSSQPAEETKSVETTEVHSPSSPTAAAKQAEEEEEAKNLPPQKKGFMVTRRERESFGSRDSTEQGQSRFFVLDHGTLSYMDSTSRKPPFSMTHREIALKGVDVQVKNNTIELTPLASSSEQDEEGDFREIVILELKNEKECAVWMDAIQEHMKISVDAK